MDTAQDSEGPPVPPDGTEGSSPDVPPPADPAIRRLTRPARRALGAIVTGAERTWHERPGARVRRVRRLGAVPLPYLMAVHPEARAARPVQVGLRSVEVADVAGTAVGGGDQRGGDFLPLKQFRGRNWTGRWQRLRAAHEKLTSLPPIDVVKFADGYWVVDGHNRVALALYAGQLEIDATVVELVPPGGRRSEPIGSLAATAAESRSLRTAASGHRPSDALDPGEPLDPETLEGPE